MLEFMFEEIVGVIRLDEVIERMVVELGFVVEMFGVSSCLISFHLKVLK